MKACGLGKLSLLLLARSYGEGSETEEKRPYTTNEDFEQLELRSPAGIPERYAVEELAGEHYGSAGVSKSDVRKFAFGTVAWTLKVM